MRKPALLFCFLAFILALGSCLARAQFHDPKDPAHWYPMECCSGLDCAPVLTATQVARPGQMPYLVVRTRVGLTHIPPDFKWRASPDGQMHVCIRPNDPNPDTNLICAFMGAGN